MSLPAVSIVMATFNRSNIIGFSIESVRRQSMSDWELIVVGDACTDDTERVVAAFNDSRIRFVNLLDNFGEQAGPNNAGFSQARADWIAYLNHDDFWLPNHLEHLLTLARARQCEFCYALELSDAGPTEVRLIHDSPSEMYTPDQCINASSWLVHRRVIERLGGWNLARDTFAVPSQDFIFRAYRAGFAPRLSPVVSVFAPSSATRPGCYAKREATEHAHIAQELATQPEAFLKIQFLRAARFEAVGRYPHTPRELLTRGASASLRWIARRFDISFAKWVGLLMTRERGGLVKRMRDNRGLSSEIPKRAILHKPADSPTTTKAV